MSKYIERKIFINDTIIQIGTKLEKNTEKIHTEALASCLAYSKF